MWFFGVVLVWWISSTETCQLSGEQEYSWVVSLRRVKTRLIDCTGTLIARNYVIAPMTCFKNEPSGGFRKGSDYEVATEVRGGCQQKRRGILVMGHHHLIEDRFRHNIAYLETEPFDIDELKPLLLQLPDSEQDNLLFVRTIVKDKTVCDLVWYKTDQHGNDFERNERLDARVDVLSRATCWNKYCPTGNRGCLPYFWAAETFACAASREKKKCQPSSVGAPLVCNNTIVGMMQHCYPEKPLVIQFFNKEQLEGISLYERIASGEEEVAPDTEEQSEPDFPKPQSDDFPTLGSA